METAWKIKAPQKLKSIILLSFMNKLHTQDFRFHVGLFSSDICSLSNLTSETVIHVLQAAARPARCGKLAYRIELEVIFLALTMLKSRYAKILFVWPKEVGTGYSPLLCGVSGYT